MSQTQGKQPGSIVYSNGTYTVEVLQNGYITVKSGDWLSKYAAAIYNNVYKIDVFNKLEGDTPVGITNKGLIEVGWTIVHMPTYNSWKGLPGAKPADQNKQELLDELAKNGKIMGTRLQGVSNAIDILGYAENGVTVAELAGEMMTLGGEMGLLSGAGAALGLMGNILFPFATVIALINAWESGLRAIGIRAIAYATTAYGFGDSMPPLPPRLVKNILASYPQNLPASIKAWNDSCNATLSNLQARVVKAGVHKQAMQAYIMGLDEQNRRKEVCINLWKALADKLPAGTPREIYLSVEPDYPK